MLPILIALCLLPPAAAPQKDAPSDPLDFSQVPAGGIQLIGKDTHRMVPEADGPGRWRFEDGVLTASPAWDSVVTPEPYGDFSMHLEFKVNKASNDEREKNGNSGVYIQQRYELQILDSFGVATGDYQAWDCGSLYRLKKPDRLASEPAGVWQSYDILFRAARFTGDRKTENARITVFQNGKLIHDDVSLARKTGAGKPEGPSPLPIKLQGHHNEVQFRNAWIQSLDLAAMPSVPADDPRRAPKTLPRPGKVFTLNGLTAFVIEPTAETRRSGPMPWVWYAPVRPRTPGPEEAWMIDRLLAKGIAIAGIDIGESYGSPEGREHYDALYAYLTKARGFAQRPVLLARSRGGLMLYGWATLHPECVAGVAGIYPVCDIASYPGVERAAPAYGLSAAELKAQLPVHNPIERLDALAAARVPILHIHGDSDTVVPLDANSAALKTRYSALGGPVEVSVLAGRGHDMWSGWFQSEAITNFMVERAHAGASRERPVKVYILAGQSNMVGIGQVNGPSTRWGAEFLDPVVSVYPGAYSEDANYGAMIPLQTQELPAFGGVRPTPFPGGGTQVVRGSIKLDQAGTYELNPGYAESTYNVMSVQGVEVHRREVGETPIRTPFRFEAGETYPFEITFFTEAADGLGWISRSDVPGTLTTIAKTEGRYPHLLDDEGQWSVRDDVHYKGLITATADHALTVGCGAGANSIGPELEFGHVMGDHHEGPVLILKTSQGNRSLGWDFLPPGSERFTHGGRTYAGYGDKIPSWTAEDPGKEVDWYAGKQYDDCFGAAHEILDHFQDHFPQYAGRGYEIAGFAWWQGHKDGDPALAARYEQNLVHLIRTLRTEFKAPRAPFAIATIGFHGWDMTGNHLAVAEAQLAVSGDTARYPDFNGNVLTVETRDFWKPASASPRNQDFHYNGNAETYLQVGGALARALIQLGAPANKK